MKSPLVSIKCLVYNHEPFLRKCLDGFVMQKTNFQFEVIVHDDASTDGSVDIIKEYAKKYPNIIKPIYEIENQYSKRDGSIGKIMRAAIHPSSKYIAMCEGDDCWIDSLKLQKQVDFLDKNEDYGLCYTNAMCHIVSSGVFFKKYSTDLPSGSCLDALIRHGNFISTLTVMYRRKIYDDLIPKLFLTHHFKMGDYPTWIEISAISKIKYIPDVTSVYRILPESASHSKNIIHRISFEESVRDIRLLYNDYFHVGLDEKIIWYDFNYSVFLISLSMCDKEKVELYYKNMKCIKGRLPAIVFFKYKLVRIGVINKNTVSFLRKIKYILKAI